jgi:CxxC motif-containing protein
MEEKQMTCVICPLGCTIRVQGEGGNIRSIEGFFCPRGDVYGRDEFINPKRVF